MNTRFSSSVTIQLNTGYGFKNNFRLEGEVGYQKDESNKDYWISANPNVSVLSFLANGYYDIPVFDAAQLLILPLA